MFDQEAQEAALLRFTQPELADFLSSASSQWGRAFRERKLRDDMLENPRLGRRIVDQILPSEVGLDLAVFAESDEAAVVARLIAGHGEELAHILGLGWFHVTVLEWITWNKLKDKLNPNLHKLARTAVEAAQEPACLDAGIGGLPNLTEVQIVAQGTILLNDWTASLSPEILHRLKHFTDLDVGQIAPENAAYVNAFVRAMTPQEA